jgi:aspartyl/asparaginyl beta-hydroxylase (cupin superfamily)
MSRPTKIKWVKRVLRLHPRQVNAINNNRNNDIDDDDNNNSFNQLFMCVTTVKQGQ